MRRMADARTMFDRALAIAPNDPSLMMRRAETKFAEGDLEAVGRLYAQLAPPLGHEGYGGHIALLAFQRK